jgi:outer membrane biosynthesis protein TonB
VAPSSRSLPAPANTPVTVIVTVAASGQVRDVSARANGRRELESCIENSVRSWRFPTSSSDTVITIPLMFAGQ